MSVTGTASFAQARQSFGAIATESGPNGGFVAPTMPNMVDFLTFLSTSVQIPVAALPLGSPWPQCAFNQAIALVLNLPGAPIGLLYSLAVYNCATHLLIMMTPDVPGQNWFVQQRSANKLLAPSTGIVAATSDETDSTTLASPEWAKGLTVAQLGFFKTPWGREYLSYIQSYGPTIVGLT